MSRLETPATLMKLFNMSSLLGASDFGISNRKTKRFFVIYKDKKIHFGSKSGQTFMEHGDVLKQKAWVKRHAVIKNKKGQYVILLKESPSYWAYRLLW